MGSRVDRQHKFIDIEGGMRRARGGAHVHQRHAPYVGYCYVGYIYQLPAVDFPPTVNQSCTRKARTTGVSKSCLRYEQLSLSALLNALMCPKSSPREAICSERI
eukprot:365643-Chlamydomonas_euryale.AAC.22